MSTETEEVNMTELNMLSTPIGSIPVTKDPVTGKVIPPEYFNELLKVACITLRDGGWGIASKQEEKKQMIRGAVVKRSTGSIEAHQKFLMVMDVVRVMTVHILERDGRENPSHLGKLIDRDSLLKCCLGKQSIVIIKTDDGGSIEVDLGTQVSFVATGSTQAVFDWLHKNSNIEEYVAKKKTFQDNLNIKKPGYANKNKAMDEDDGYIDGKQKLPDM